MQNISSSEGAARFAENIRKLVVHLSADRHSDSAEAERKLGEIPLGAGRIAGPIAFSTLGTILSRRETVTMGELTKELLIPPATTNRLVTWWVENGLAERLRDPSDKRVIRVRITGAGRRFQKINQEIGVTRVKSFFNQLTPEETTIFSLLFDKLISNLENLATD